MKTKFLLFSFLLSLLFSSFAMAESRQAIQERISERDEAISALLLEQKVGETNRGFLSARDDLTRAEKELMEAENEDREALYEILAEEVGRSAEEIGIIRARQLAERSVPGVWLQNRRGEWFIKE
ncbi:MAG: YdbL family protein [Opitutales bacterium]|nr:YdbL family protein [Opitutales bacterium]